MALIIELRVNLKIQRITAEFLQLNSRFQLLTNRQKVEKDMHEAKPSAL